MSKICNSDDEPDFGSCFLTSHKDHFSVDAQRSEGNSRTHMTPNKRNFNNKIVVKLFLHAALTMVFGFGAVYFLFCVQFSRNLNCFVSHFGLVGFSTALRHFWFTIFHTLTFCNGLHLIACPLLPCYFSPHLWLLSAFATSAGSMDPLCVEIFCFTLIWRSLCAAILHFCGGHVRNF